MGRPPSLPSPRLSIPQLRQHQQRNQLNFPIVVSLYDAICSKIVGWLIKSLVGVRDELRARRGSTVSPLLPHVRRSKLKTLEETPSSHSSSIRIDVLAQTSCHSSVHPFRRRLVRFKLDRRPELSASSRLPFPFGHPAALSRRCFVVVGEHVFYG
ncbi:hypothetical protein BDY24DRAFT_437300 [Mrakia frigida]|uniref:uncharacterized protein n=1 Tax=Mrakia frigida TaxID=29902 RepID=UPI003FCC067D